jgi:hypothetical protein
MCYIRSPPLLHATAGVATSSRCRCCIRLPACYMRPPPLLVATCRRRLCYVRSPACYMEPPPLLHVGVAVAASRRRRCYVRSPPCYMEPLPLLQAGDAVAASRRHRCYSPSAAGDATSGQRYQGVSDGDARKCVCAARAGRGVRRWPWHIPSLVTFTFFFFVFLEALTTDGSASYGWGPGGSGILIPRGTLSRPLTFFTCTRTWSAHVPLQT